MKLEFMAGNHVGSILPLDQQNLSIGLIPCLTTHNVLLEVNMIETYVCTGSSMADMTLYSLSLSAGLLKNLTLYRMLMGASVVLLGYGGVVTHLLNIG